MHSYFREVDAYLYGQTKKVMDASDAIKGTGYFST